MGAVATVPPGFPRARTPGLRARIAATVAAFESVGKTVAAVDVRPDGSFRAFTGAQLSAADIGGGEPNEWDEVIARP